MKRSALNETQVSHPFTYWARLVQASCGMSFANLEDQAVTFAGIISLLRPHLDEHLVSLWQIFLPREFLWIAVEPSSRQKPLRALRAPSKSWLSIGVLVKY